MSLKILNNIADKFPRTPRMPVLFLGHGSPMNAIEENEFVAGFRRIAATLPRPVAILCVSAHWETRGTQLTAMEMPETIHDFGGFPRALYEVQYPAPGSPELAKLTRETVSSHELTFDHSWGLDHGAWSVLRHLYPEADIPVVQMSLDYLQNPDYHYELARQLQPLRERGVLIVGSGNMVHNLRMLDWRKIDQHYAYDWALEAAEKMRHFILDGDHKGLINFRSHGKAFDYAVPTPEHYLPLLYAVGLQQKGEAVELLNDKPLGGSLTMTSLKIG